MGYRWALVRVDSWNQIPFFSSPSNSNDGKSPSPLSLGTWSTKGWVILWQRCIVTAASTSVPFSTEFHSASRPFRLKIECLADPSLSFRSLVVESRLSVGWGLPPCLVGRITHCSLIWCALFDPFLFNGRSGWWKWIRSCDWEWVLRFSTVRKPETASNSFFSRSPK